MAQDARALQGGSLKARQQCLDLEHSERCLGDLEEIIEDPGQLLKRDGPQFDEAGQEAICTTYGGVSPMGKHPYITRC